MKPSRVIIMTLICWALAAVVMTLDAQSGTGWRIRSGTEERFVGTAIAPNVSGGATIGTAARPWGAIFNSGHITPGADSTYDLGAASTGRFRTLYVGTVQAATDINITNTAGFTLTTRATAASAPGANVVRIYTREDVDSSGAGGADCDLVALLSTSTEVVIKQLVLNGGCP